MRARPRVPGGRKDGLPRLASHVGRPARWVPTRTEASTCGEGSVGSWGRTAHVRGHWCAPWDREFPANSRSTWGFKSPSSHSPHPRRTRVSGRSATFAGQRGPEGRFRPRETPFGWSLRPCEATQADCPLARQGASARSRSIGCDRATRRRTAASAAVARAIYTRRHSGCATARPPFLGPGRPVVRTDEQESRNQASRISS